VLSGGHFTRVVISLRGFRCYPCVICRVDTSVVASWNFFGSFVLQDLFLSSLKISSGGTKFEIFREQVGYLHFVLLRWVRMFDILLQDMLLLILCSVIFIFVVAVVFLVESYRTGMERRSYVSFSIVIELFDLAVCSFRHCKSKDPVNVTRKSVDCFACCL